MLTRGRALAVAAGLLAPGLLARPASAGADDVATAQVLFDDARKLMSTGRFSEACPKLQESQRLAPAIGTEYNLADCWEHDGKLASAWAAFLDVVDQTHKRGEAQREGVARARAAAIAPKLGRLLVDVPRRVAGLEIRRDGELVPPEAWGVAVPVDAGDHRIEARAPGFAPWTGAVHAADGQSASIAVPALAPASSPAPAPAPAPPTPTATPTATATPTPTSTPTPTADHTAALIVLGGAVILAAVGAVGLVEHDAQVSAYNGDSSCPPIGSASRPAQCNDYVSAADNWKTIGTIGFVTSGVAVAAGVALWLLAPRRSAQAAFACGVGAGSVACAGAF